MYNNHFIALLIMAVSEKFGKEVIYPKEFESLSASILEITHEKISVSTIKRIFGYIEYKGHPSLKVLNIFSYYLGYKDFSAFKKQLKNNDITYSTFFNSNILLSQELKKDEIIELAWRPNRYLVIQYKGDNTFKVTRSENSKLLAGDVFKSEAFFIGKSFIAMNVIRDNTPLGNYIAGDEAGITLLSKCCK